MLYPSYEIRVLCDSDGRVPNKLIFEPFSLKPQCEEFAAQIQRSIAKLAESAALADTLW